MNTQTVILDVDKRYDPSQVVTIGQGDKSGTTIVAEVYDKGVSVSLSGYTAEFEMRLPDGRNYVRDNDCTVSGNTITYVVDEEHCGAAAGHTNECYFNIKSGSSVIYSTSRFRMDVLRAAHDGAVPSESWDSAIEEAIENANEAAEEAREAAGGTVPLMSATQRGGAKLGDGLALTGEALGVDPLTTTDIDTVSSDGSLTSSKSLTGTMLTYLWSKIKAKFASLANGAVAISQGGTGATTAALARTNLEVVKDSAIAYVESTTATANHAIGDYFMLGNVLMKATAAIAAGETINASKATPATVQGQIDTLRDSVADDDLKFEVKNRNYGNVAPEVAIESILTDMVESSTNKAEVGVFFASGYHAYIAHRYQSGTNYGSVLYFDPWGRMVLGRLDNGTFSYSRQSIRTVDLTVTTGTTTYSAGHYYGDVDLGVAVNSIISLTVITVTDNHAVSVQIVNSRSIRAYSYSPSVTVTVRVAYII